jgi:hypothetical protein
MYAKYVKIHIYTKKQNMKIFISHFYELTMYNVIT